MATHGRSHEFGAKTPGGYDIELHGGDFLDLAKPSATDIRVDDIAHGLSYTCRFAGQCSRFYSVAEHAYRVAARLEDQNESLEVVIWGLHHDDSEAYIGDVTAPLKNLLGRAYRDIELAVEAVIVEALGLPEIDDDGMAIVKKADYDMLQIEAHSLMPSRGETWWNADQWDGSLVPRRSTHSNTEWAMRWLLMHSKLMTRLEARHVA